MTGWILFISLLCFLIGAAIGLAVGVYSSAKAIAKMIEDEEITYKEQK